MIVNGSKLSNLVKLICTLFLCLMLVLHLNKRSTGTRIGICLMLIMIDLRKIRVLQVVEAEEE
jgi:hypothetical protein